MTSWGLSKLWRQICSALLLSPISLTLFTFIKVQYLYLFTLTFDSRKLCSPGSVIWTLSHARPDDGQPRSHILQVVSLHHELLLASAVRLQHERVLVVWHLEGRRLASFHLMTNQKQVSDGLHQRTPTSVIGDWNKKVTLFFPKLPNKWPKHFKWKWFTFSDTKTLPEYLGNFCKKIVEV